MSASLALRVLPPVGDAVSLSSRGAPLPWPAERTFLLASGTASLAFVLAAITKRADAAGNSAREVLIPSYGCPDVVSAIVFAGLKPRLVPLADGSPFPSQEAWKASIDSKTLALVTVGFMGLRDPLTPAQVAPSLEPACFVEDCCQVHPGTVSALADRSVAFSFGRGKPVALLHGGAAVLEPTLAPSRPAVPAKAGEASGFLKFALNARLYNLLRWPRLYSWVRLLPGLGVGTTVLTPLAALEPMNSRISPYLDVRTGAPEARRRSLQARVRKDLQALGPAVFDLWAAHGRDDDWLLRYPLLMHDRATRDRALVALDAAGLGASAMYEVPLVDIPGVGPLVTADPSDSTTKSFADRLLTLPLHSGVTERDLVSMTRVLREVIAP
jgi:dTDP-4-amino-4,6-dideoxygalactose transaminase